MVEAALVAMRKEGSSIVNISSIYGIVGGAEGYKIRVNSIHPGYSWTPMVRSMV